MPDPVTTPNPSEEGNNNNQPATPPGDDPKPTDNGGSEPIDFSKLDDDTFYKALEDPRLWRHSRIKNLTADAKELKQLREEKAKQEEARLEEEGKLKELNEKLKADREQAISKYQKSIVDNAIQSEAVRLGANPKAVKLINQSLDRSGIKIDDQDSVQGVEEAVKSLLEDNPYLLGGDNAGGGNRVKIGSGTNPGEGGPKQPPRFKHSQLRDPQFYREHEKEIHEALKLGLIEDDLN